MVKPLSFYLKVSRPGLWFQTLWLYLLPSSASEAWRSPPFWVGLVYMTFPINFLMYGWNDMVDRETDRHNPRKDSFVWGARGTRDQLRRLPLPIALVQLPFFTVFIYWDGLPMAGLLTALLAVNMLYNLPRRGWRDKPPLELVNVLGILLILPLSIRLTGVSVLPSEAVLYLAVFCLQAHLIGEIMDMAPDRQAGRRTTALWIGAIPARLTVMGLVALEGALLLFHFQERLLAGFMLFCVFWLIFDLAVLYKRGPYSAGQFKLMALGLNVSGYGSLIWVWLNGSLTI